jgi:hypothetical protein
VASLEEVGCVYKVVVCGPTGAELVEVAPAGSTQVVVAAEVGLSEAALVELAVAKVVVLVAVAELAAGETCLQLALHCKSESFYMEACTRYHHIFQSLSFAACSTFHFYLSLVAASSSFCDAQLSTLLCHSEC